MRYPSPTLDGFDALWSNPLRWFARQFLIYGAVAAITAVIVVIAAGIYALLVPAKEMSPPIPGPELEIIKPVSPPNKIPDTTGAFISQLPTEPIGKPIYVNGIKFGTVDKLIVDSDGKIQFFVIARSGPIPEKESRTFTVSADAIKWHAVDENKLTVGEVAYESVRSAFSDEKQH